MIKYHPESEQIKYYAQGSLSIAEAIMVSAHCDLCPQCRRQVIKHTETVAEDIFCLDYPTQPTVPTYQFDAMLASITQLPVSKKIHPTARISPKIELDGKTFSLPITFARLINKMGNWSSLIGRLWQAPVDLEISGVANFVYMGEGGSIPEHTHRGNEITLVLYGDFHDGVGRYSKGDYISMNEKHTHAPYSPSRNGCLVFTIVDQPLQFSASIAQLINPFSHLFFR